LKADNHILVSSAGTIGAFNRGFDRVNLHHPARMLSVSLGRILVPNFRVSRKNPFQFNLSRFVAETTDSYPSNAYSGAERDELSTE
jgi:hypothetical protein